MNLVHLLLRDGAIYFIIMACANLTNILTFYLANDSLRGVLSTFASTVSVVAMSRLSLNLYETGERGGESQSASGSSGATRMPETGVSVGLFTSQIDRPWVIDGEVDMELGEIAGVGSTRQSERLQFSIHASARDLPVCGVAI